MRRDEKMVSTLLAHGADPNIRLRTWTPTRRSSDDFNFPPELIGATPFWLAARFTAPAVMRLLLKHGADPLFVHHSEHMTGGTQGNNGFVRRTNVTTAVMAATGMGAGGRPWVPPDPAEREALMLESVKLAAEPGVDLNAVNTDGRTALDAAKALKYETVVAYLAGKGARSGKPQSTK